MRVLGVLLTPVALPGLFISIDAWSIRMKDQLRGPTVQELVSYADDFPGKIERVAALGWQRALGWVGPVTRVDLRPVHITRLESNSVDVALRYRLPVTSAGIFTVSGQLETVQRYEGQATVIAAKAQADVNALVKHERAERIAAEATDDFLFIQRRKRREDNRRWRGRWDGKL